ncbi:MAG TPA: hypothetical protein VK132_09690, partial [Gemmatimonadales bacterium]|nr:hypothetical protein [Gemmatimonadales bacterium]
NGGRLDWSRDNVIVFDRPGSDGYFDIYTIRPDGSGETCLTCGPRPGFPLRHKGNPAWHPSGQYIAFQAQKLGLSGPTIDPLANPGSGLNNDLWVMDRNGTRAWRMTNTLPLEGGVLHPHFSPAGDRLLWSERVAPGGRYGEWVLRLADFGVDAEGPRIDTVRTYQPGAQRRFYEPHGFSLDGRRILFSGNLEPGQDELFIDIYWMDLETQALVDLTPAPGEWDEHAQLSPSGDRIVWMSSLGAPVRPQVGALQTDYWIMNADGSNKARLTHFNDRTHPEYIPGGVIAADSAWSPDGSRLAGYLITDPKRVLGRIVLIDVGMPTGAAAAAAAEPEARNPALPSPRGM